MVFGFFVVSMVLFFLNWMLLFRWNRRLGRVSVLILFGKI